ncbi:uncharacterized protein LOC121245840 isoform X1 [Juglans microcarpa x Juglans regia]|uniref:uncharacterized protein LOC121245840 isoform X1 n=1 Tax=Juglans microcarpa x Juglans regia TaxID=2249226 RepID=UPI001B7EEC9E|nr:uncharacterized protein LOC121245840 isoform X1 [Juglans microcarpa x Juglans regia]XP_040999654.1 uncharacterized protein LOC121245840 isoform X1 [Juglans microcarpa x Juglans regia]XP_040999655.1 uncharacterized protein LOC121245840 isoform X1 [Juglans microcarpa x Juglans regia]XP_040999656.1 uncharacterized protein LOC121245840 isoform X1 [Juglans microcarpa x Juglans regia]
MKVENENLEPVTDLGLSVGYSDRCIQRQPKDEGASAGANAGSRIDMTFLGSNPLSELVWSPHKGLSLKCAECGFTDKKGPLMWGAGSSNVAFSLPQSISGKRSATGKPIDEEVITPQAALYANDNVAGANNSTRSSTRHAGIIPGCGSNNKDETGPVSDMEEMSSAVELSVLHIAQEDHRRKSEGQVNGRNADTLSIKIDEPKPDVVVNEPFSADLIGGGRDLGSEQILGMNIALASDVHPVDECKGSETSVKNLKSPGRRPLEKLEQTAENELRTPIGENARGAVTKRVESEFAHKLQNSFQHNKEVLQRNITFQSELSPANRNFHRNQRKGKEKALSDGDIKERSSKEGNDSHESVESCNSAGLFLTRKKRPSFEECLISGSKRVKKQIEKIPCSTSYIRQDSSFMNWITNMMKGFSKPILDETPSPALVIAPPDHGHQDPNDQNLLACNKNQDPGLKNIGFRSIFQSLYGPKVKGETTSLNAKNENGESKEHELANKMCNINATPIAIRGDDDNKVKPFLQPNEKFDLPMSGNGAASATQPRVFPLKFSTFQKIGKTNSREDKNSCRVEFGREKNETSSTSTLCKDKIRSAENIAPDPPSEGKSTNDFSYRNDPLGSLWITRFCSKTSRPLLNPDDCSQSISVGVECSNDCMRLLPCPWNHDDNNHKSLELKEHSAEDPMPALGNESQKHPADTEAVIGSKRMKCHNHQESAYKLNPILPSPKFRSAMEMSSIFARRLDALKHVMPSDVTDNAKDATTTCVFCGIEGHHLQECSEITENEIEDLLRNSNSYKAAKEFPCLCIRCFQLNHWAVACPSASSSGKHQTTGVASMAGPSKMLHKEGNRENLKLITGWGRQFLAACDENDLGIPKHSRWKPKEMIAPVKTISNANLMKKHIAPSFGVNYSKEQKIMLVKRKLSDVPKGIFNTIKGLRLSRSDILKWMNSYMSLSHLDGFFLRVRLGKWEGLQGTGYHVACITGKQRENSPQNAKNPVCVNVGGNKFLVGSQYISNHDFLEDELMTWWNATSTDSGKIPSEEDLTAKIKKKRMLGL